MPAFGNADAGNAILRDQVNVTVGFRQLGGLTAESAKGPMRMFGPNDSPRSRNLFQVIGCLQDFEGLHLEDQSVRCGSTVPEVPMRCTEGYSKTRFPIAHERSS